MTETTVLDLAHEAMEASPGDDAARLRFYERVADAELFLLLDPDAPLTDLKPMLFAVPDGRFVLAFDREERLAAFNDAPSPYAALPGRVIVQTLAGQQTGLGLNLGVAPSSFLMPHDAVDWLALTLRLAPQRAEARIAAFGPPLGIPERLLTALDAKLAMMPGLAASACLAGVTYADGRRGNMLVFLDPRVGAEDALAKAVSEALTFSGIDAGELDVTFMASGSPAAQKATAAGLRFDLPKPVVAPEPSPARQAPGTDPSRPPRLR